LRKNLHDEDPKRDYRIFFAISERDGKNSKGQFVFRVEAVAQGPLWERVDHDLQEVAERYQEFCRAEALLEA
jgi:type I restriction enzyme M protein